MNRRDFLLRIGVLTAAPTLGWPKRSEYMQGFFAFETTGFANVNVPRAVGVNMHTEMCGSVTLPFGEYQLPDGERVTFDSIDSDTHEPVFKDLQNRQVPFSEIAKRFAS